MTSLPIATDGPCASHRCDGCRTCQRGRCCRRDDDAYRLPKRGDWDGPLHAPLNQLVSDDGGITVRCHVCGESWLQLGSHAWMRHDLTAAEYKALFGLPQKTALAGEETRARHSLVAKNAIAAGRIDPDANRARSLEVWTREQASQAGQRAIVLQRAGGYGHTTPGEDRRLCKQCGGPMPMPMRSRITCSPACRKRGLQAAARKAAKVRNQRIRQEA